MTSRRWMLVWLVSFAVSAFFLIYPIYVIQPFRAQGPGELAVALWVSRVRPAVTLVSAALAVLALVGYWRVQRRIVWRVAAILGTALVAFFAFLGQINIYELMFHHLDRPQFADQAQVKLDSDEKVIAVKVGDAARAYPIRIISYHHVVNDVVGQTAIVATY